MIEGFVTGGPDEVEGRVSGQYLASEGVHVDEFVVSPARRHRLH
jgi:phosphohistidine phosphatase SixA